MTGLVLLAAGASTRLGKPKQNLLYKGETLLQHAVRAALGSVCAPVVVVLGAEAKAILPDVAAKPVTVVHNPLWQDGMASSVRTGLATVLDIEPNVAACVFMVCDQPFTEATLVDALVQKHQQSGKGMVACAYNNTMGTPALLDRRYFQELLALEGQEGAKKLLYLYEEDVVTIPFPGGAFDIDTAADYQALLES